MPPVFVLCAHTFYQDTHTTPPSNCAALNIIGVGRFSLAGGTASFPLSLSLAMLFSLGVVLHSFI